MTPLNSAVSVCRNCQHYAGQGRRGGQCNRLGAPVSGSWSSCSLAIPPFAPTWEMPEKAGLWNVGCSPEPLGITPHSMIEALEVCIQAELSEESVKQVVEVESSMYSQSTSE
ncbi:MAG: hypothetical protein WBA57_08820 [Elainellaceae cyanobacterium]